MLNFIFSQRNQYGLAQRKINQLLSQEGGCQLEELLAEDESVVNQCRSANSRLVDFMCQRKTLQKLVGYATQVPSEEDSADVKHKYPFVAADILASSKTIAQALVEGGYDEKPEEGDEDEVEATKEGSSVIRYEESNENKLVQQILQGTKDTSEGKEKETVVEELNLKEDKEDSPAINEPEGEDAEKTKEAAEAVKDESENVEDAAEAEEKKEPAATAVDDKAVEEAEGSKYDFSLLDQLVDGFLSSTEELLPILCGYFNKIVQSLINKHKSVTLEYLLLRREGKIFDMLLNHMQNHSLAILLIELLQLQIKSQAAENKKNKMAFYQSDSEEKEEGDEAEGDAALTADELKMKQVIADKGNLAVMKLLESLSSKNQTDIYQTLNASTVLLDFCDNEQCFAMLTAPEPLSRLIDICCQGSERNRQNLPYALNILSTIINQFAEAAGPKNPSTDEGHKGGLSMVFGGATPSSVEKEISEERKAEMNQVFMAKFADMAYNCIILLREDSTFAPYENQSHIGQVKRIGTVRIRAMELIKTLLSVLSKIADLKNDKVLSSLLRKKVIDTMLHVLRTYPFCSVAHQQGIISLNAIKEAFDQEDVQVMKDFVQEMMTEHEKLVFESGNTTSAANMGQIIQIAFELRHLTQNAIDDESSDMDPEDDNMTPEQREKHNQTQKWVNFCRNKVDKIERTWNRKLEEPENDDDRSSKKDSDVRDDRLSDDDDNGQIDIQRLLDKIAAKQPREKVGAAGTGLNRSASQYVTDDKNKEELAADVQAGLDAQDKKAHDDSEMHTEQKEFSNNNYWRVEANQFALEDLLKEADL